MNTQIRKNEINLEILGTAIITFGIWAIIKNLILSPIYNQSLSNLMADDALNNLNIIIWAVLAVDVLIRCLIGISARAEGRGKPRGIWYLILTAVFFAFYVITVILEIIAFANMEDTLIEAIATVIIDATSAVLLFEVLVYGIRLHRLRKNNNEGNKLHES